MLLLCTVVMFLDGWCLGEGGLEEGGSHQKACCERPK